MKCNKCGADNKISVAQVELLYNCPDCGTDATQALCEVVDNGTAMCDECDILMDLVGVKVE